VTSGLKVEHNNWQRGLLQAFWNFMEL